MSVFTSILGSVKHAAAGGPAFVQQQVRTLANGGGGNGALFDVPATAGNSLFICLSYLSTATLSVEPILLGGDDDGTPLTLAINSTVSGTNNAIYYIHNVVGNESGISYTTNGGRTSANISEWSGLANAAVENTNSNTGTASATVTTNTATPVSAHNLVIAMGSWTADDYSTGPINSFERMTQVGGGAVWQESAYLSQSSATAKSTGWGLTAGINWAACIAAFGGS